MLFLHIVIAGRDEDYICRITSWIRENRPDQFKVSAFTKKESFRKYMKASGKEADIVLAEEEFLAPEQLQEKNVIILGQPEKDEYENLQYIEKYQPAPAILSNILSLISMWNKELVKWNKAGKSEIILCISPEPHLKSTLALWLALISSKHVYMNFESFPFYLLKPDNQQFSRNISDVLYHIKASRGNIGIVLESAVYTDSTGINIVPPMDNPGDLWELSEKENEIFLKSLSLWARYTRIIADIEWNACSRTIQWIQAASRIFIPFCESQPHQLVRFRDMIMAISDESIQKIRWIYSGNSSNRLPDNFGSISVITSLNVFPYNWRETDLNCTFSNQLEELLR